ncbi:MAG: hypothetical protein GX369_05065 [Euryarchaeota archaeon]|nr:hypothetical protein [Euryarchaeota archaeon]
MKGRILGSVLIILFVATLFIGNPVYSWFSHEFIGSDNKPADDVLFIAPGESGSVPTTFTAEMTVQSSMMSNDDSSLSKTAIISNGGTMKGVLFISFKDLSYSSSDELNDYLLFDISINGEKIISEEKIIDYTRDLTNNRLIVSMLQAEEELTMEMDYYIDSDAGVEIQDISLIFKIVYNLEQYVPNKHDHLL